MDRITVQDIEQIVGFEISDQCKDMIDKFDLVYQELNEQERDDFILDAINTIYKKDLVKVGKHRLESWEKGWNENFELFKQGTDITGLVPKYFGKYNIFRWKEKLIKSNSKYFDYHQLIILVDAYLHKYVGDKYDNIFEFGCGPAYHLLRFGNFNKNINLIGLDWTKTSQTIIQNIADSKLIPNKITGYNFNFYEPDYNIDIPENSVIFTCSSLEQIGEDYKAFVDFLLTKKPELCINFEPMSEFLNDKKLLDKISILYSEKRNYLKGYLSYLEQLEKENKIEIILKERLYGGTPYLEGNQIVIWKVK